MGGIRPLSRVVIATVLYYIAVVAILHFLQPDLDPMQNPMSAYVLTDSGTLMTTTYFAMAVGLMCLVLGLRRVLPRTTMFSIGLALFSVAAIASATAGIFHGEPPPPKTVSGIIHLTCGVIYSFAMAAAIVLITLSVRKDARWQSVGVLVLWLAAGVVISTFLFPIMTPLGGGGLAQRISFALHFLWIIVVAYQMPRVVTAVTAVPDHMGRA